MRNDKSVAEIRRLNDLLRCHRVGGRIMVSRGIAALGSETVATILAAVASFDAFDGNNDPHGEHDCAFVEVGTLRVLFKIDYYDTALSSGSEDPSDPKVTIRVLTIMLPEEY